MVAAILPMILADAVHPPAVSTALSFALRAGDESNVALFGVAVGITALLVGCTGPSSEAKVLMGCRNPGFPLVRRLL